MALSAFDDKSRPPAPADLDATLGRSANLWRELIDRLAEAHPPLSEDWTFAGVKWGWSLRLKSKKRAIVYLTPCAKHFLAGFALGEKACAAAKAVPLPDAVLEVIDAAPRYAEGRGVRLEVRYRRDLEGVLGVAAVKMAT